jgi:hypothetical protein
LRGHPALRRPGFQLSHLLALPGVDLGVGGLVSGAGGA